MAREQRVTDGVTVTWAGPTPKPRRRSPRRAAPVRVTVRPVPDVRPDDEDLRRIARVRDREQLAALLGGDGPLGESPGGPMVSGPDLRRLAVSLVNQGMERCTLLLALIELGHSDVDALHAVWWGSLADRRVVVLVLLQEEGWPGERLHDALTDLGLGVRERATVVDPWGS